MQGTNFLAIIAATVAAFLFSSIWYISFGKARMKLLNNENASADMRRVPAAQKLFELWDLCHSRRRLAFQDYYRVRHTGPVALAAI